MSATYLMQKSRENKTNIKNSCGHIIKHKASVEYNTKRDQRNDPHGDMFCFVPEQKKIALVLNFDPDFDESLRLKRVQPLVFVVTV